MENESFELELVRDIFGQISKDMGSMLERELSFRGICYRRAEARGVGAAEVHVSFRFAFESDGAAKLGCFLLPLPEANAMAAYLLAMGEPAVEQARGIDEPDTTMKESMLLLGCIFSGSVGRALKRHLPRGMRVRFDGCQGVRADVRPAFPYLEGEPLILGRAAARVGSSKPFSPILMLPILA